MNAEGPVEGDGHAPTQHARTGPVEDGGEVDKAARHRDIRDVHRPDLVRPGVRPMPQEIGKHGMRAVAAAGAGLRTQGGNPHVEHQGADPSASHTRDIPALEAAQHVRACKREVQVQHIDLPHQREVAGRRRAWRVVHRAAADPQRRGLPRHGERVRPVDHRVALSRPALPSACSKKSFSSASSPKFAWSVFTPTGGSPGPPRKTPAAPERSWSFHAVIRPGWRSNRLANSASMPSFRTAARATFALKAGAWLRRGRFDIGDFSAVANMSPGEPAVHSANLFRQPRPLHSSHAPDCPGARLAISPSSRRDCFCAMPLVHCRSLLLRAAGPAHRRSFHRYGWRALPGADPASSPGRGAIGAPVRAGQGAIACVASVGRYRRKTVWLLFASHSVSPEMLNA